MINTTFYKRGFTLIELLVVVSIIGLLSSTVLASLSSAREKARDSRRVSDFRAITTAFELNYDATGGFPGNPVPGSAVCSPSSNFETVMQELVTRGFLSAIPTPPRGSPYEYCYYNYGPNDARGALMVTVLETMDPSTDGIPPSCRPFTGSNWCRSDIVSTYYCICHVYQNF